MLQNRIYRAEAKDEEILTAVDRTVDKLESQIPQAENQNREAGSRLLVH
jgi:ribosome-associated translation inhibitor RaiA